MESAREEPSVRERVIPVENIQLMFHYKQPFISYLPDGTTMIQPSSFVSGLNNSFSDAETKGETGVIFVSFTPAGACFFFPFPLTEIRNQVIDLSLIYYKEIKQTEELLYSGNSADDMIRVIEQFLLNRFRPVSAPGYKIVENAVYIIKQHKGQIPADMLAKKLSVTGKTLERKFSEYIGMTPKKYTNLIRFQNILTDISSDISLTQCSYKYGYFDQSHFIKDFRLFTGYSPLEFRKKYSGCDNVDIDPFQ